jgi:hypothetical protein
MDRNGAAARSPAMAELKRSDGRADERNMRCMSGAKCEQPAVEGERFCDAHLEELHRIRAEFVADGKLDVRTGRKPTCQTAGCANHRIPPNPLCAECAEGTIDELAA